MDGLDPAGAQVEFQVSAMDLVDGTREVSCSPQSGSKFTVGVTTVLCQSVDSRANVSAGTLSVTVRDAASPQLELDGEPVGTVSSEEGEPVDFDFAVTATDAVDGDLETVCNPASGVTLIPGEHPVHCEAVDAAGNVGELDFTLTVQLVSVHTKVESLIAAKLPHVFNEGYRTNLPMGSVHSMPSTTRIVLNTTGANGELARIVAEGNFGYVDSSGAVRLINTSLEPVSGGYSPRGVAYDVTLPERYADGVRWGLGGSRGNVVATPVDVNSNAPVGAVVQDGDQLLYPLAWPVTDVVATTTGEGISEHLIARNADAQRTYSWRLSKPAGAAYRLDEDGFLVIDFADGSTQLLSRNPRARDASGQQVAASFSLTETGSSTLLSLTWNTLPETMGGTLERPVVWPVDIDPDFIHYGPQPGVTPYDTGGGASAACSPGLVFLQFAGAASFGDGARASCTYAAPDENYELTSLTADFGWSLSPGVNEVSFLDADGLAPNDSAGNYLEAFTSDEVGVPRLGSTSLHWDLPAGAAEFSLDVTDGETDVLGAGASRHADLKNVVRIYGGYDVTEPVISALEPAADGHQVLPGSPMTFSVSGSDSQTACASGSIVVTKVALDGSEAEVLRVPFGGCSYAFAYAFHELGDYNVTYTIHDSAENYAEESRSFEIYDPIDPVITGLTPSTDNQLLAAGPINLAVSGFDQHTICTKGTIAVAKLAEDGSETPITTAAFPTCNYSFAPVLSTPGEYSVTYTIFDAADNVAEETRSLLVADPIVSIANGEVLDGSVDIDLELGQNLTYGTAQLMATGPYGYSFPIGAPFAAGGYRTITVDTRAMQNGDYTLALVLYNNAGVHTQETVSVTVDNLRAVTGTSGSFSASAVGANFSVVHTSGNLAGSMSDLQQTGWAAMPMSLERVYNQQPILFADDSFGPGWRSSWDRQLIEGIDRVVTYVDGSGRTWTFVPNGPESWIAAPGQRGVLRASTDPATAAQQPREMVFPDGRLERFDTSGHLVREVWPMGQSLSYTRSSSERTVDDGNGHRIVATIDASGRITSAKDAIDRTWTYAYNTAGRLAEVTDPNQSRWQFRYESDGRLKEIEDPRDLVTGVAYDASSDFPRVSSLTYPIGTAAQPETATRSFDYESQLADVVETYGNRVTKVALDEAGRPSDRIDPRDNARSIEYNGFGQVTSTVNEAGEHTELRYDGAGNLTESIVHVEDDTDTPAVEPDRVTHYSNFDAFGNARRVEDPLHQVTAYTFDQYGNERTRTLPSGQTWETFYEEGTPQPTSTKDPLQQVRSYDYDATGQLTDEQYVDAEGLTQHVVRNTYDVAGQRETTRDGSRPPQSFTYDGLGRPKTSVDENGNYTETFYDPTGNVLHERDKEGNFTSHTYDRQGYRRSTTAPAGDATGTLPRTTTFEVDQYGNTLKTTDPLGHFTQATFDEGGNKLTETDATGAVTEYVHDPMGRVLTKSEEGSVGTIDAVTGQPDSAPVVSEFQYDSTGALRYTIVDDVLTAETTYRADGSTLDTIDAEGVQLTHGYDANGNSTTETDLNGDFTDTKYDVVDQQIATVDEVGQRTDSKLDEQGRVVEEIAPGTVDRFTATVGPNDARSLYKYGLADEVTQETDPLNKVWKYGFEPSGRLQREEDPEGGAVSYTYDANGAIKTETNEIDGVTTVERYPNGQIRWVEAPDGTRVEYEYDAAGNLRLERDEAGEETLYSYDSGNRLVEEEAPDGTVTAYEYDARSNVVAETAEAVRDANGELVGGTRTTYVYDTRGDVRRITGAGLTTSFTFDKAHRLTSRVEPDGRVTSYTYYPTGELKQEIDPTKGTTTYTYDKAGRVKTIVDPDGTSTFNYDPAGRVKSIAAPNVSQNYTYDKAGNPISGGKFGDSRTMTYDGANRIKSFMAGGFASTVDLRYTYDKAGNVKTMGTPNIFSTSFDYSTSGQPKSQTNQTGTESYLYDPTGRLEFFTDGSGATTKLRYDERGMQISEIAQAGGAFSSFTGYQEGLVTGSTDYAGLSQRRVFYSHVRSSRTLQTEFSDNPAEHVVVGREYSYASGRLARIDLRAQVTGPAVSGEYMEQVRSCIKPVGCFDPEVGAAMAKFEQPGIDVAGLQLSATELKVAEAIELAANVGSPFVLREFHYAAATGRLAWIQDHTTGKRVDYTYDAQGRQVTRKRTGEQTNLSDSSTSFDSEGHLYYSVERPGSVQNMNYDADDRLITKLWTNGTTPTSPRVETEYRYDADGQLFRFTSNSRHQGQWEAQVFHNSWGLASMRVKKIDPSFTNVTFESYYFHFNHRGDVVSITDATGAVAARYIYNAWGEFTATGDPILIEVNPFTYQGRFDTIWDSYHKRYFMGERWYDPYQARFLTPDAEEAQPGKVDGPYTYAVNDPVNYTDADGRKAKQVVKAPKLKIKPKKAARQPKPRPVRMKPAPRPKAKPKTKPAPKPRVSVRNARRSTDFVRCLGYIQRPVRRHLRYIKVDGGVSCSELQEGYPETGWPRLNYSVCLWAVRSNGKPRNVKCKKSSLTGGYGGHALAVDTSVEPLHLARCGYENPYVEYFGRVSWGGPLWTSGPESPEDSAWVKFRGVDGYPCSDEAIK